MTNDLSEKIVELIKQGKRDEVEKLLEETVAIISETAEDYLRRGIGYAHLGKTDEALADYRKAVELNPSNIDARLRLGGMFTMLDQYEKALDEYERVIRLDPDNPHGHRSKVNIIVELDGVKVALKYLDNLLQTLPEYADDSNYCRAGLLALDSEYYKALAVLDEVHDPGSILLPTYAYYLTKAWALCSLERFDEALDAIEEGMNKTLEEDGCVPCFTNNCWRVEHLELLRNPPYRKRLEAIIGPKPKLARKTQDR